VPFEDAELQILKCSVENRGEALIVVVWYLGDRHNVNVHAVPLVKWTGSSRELRKRDQVGALAFQDVYVRCWSRQAVTLSHDESAEAMQFHRSRQLCVEIPKERTPRLRKLLRRHWRVQWRSP